MMSEEELSQHMQHIIRSQHELQQNQKNKMNNCENVDYRLNIMDLMKEIMAERMDERLQGGEMPISPTVWAILTTAANKIENYINSIKRELMCPPRRTC